MTFHLGRRSIITFAFGGLMAPGCACIRGKRRTSSPTSRTRNQPQCRHSGQPVGQDDGKRGLRGYDGGKKVKGRKRHLLVDTQGFLLQPVVHTADVADRDGGKLVLLKLEPWKERFPRMKHLWLDSAYQGKFEEWVKATFGWSVEVVKHWWTGVRYVWVAPGQEPPTLPSGFHVLPHRWIVERTFGWLGRHRRLSKDYEYLPETSETWIYIAMSRLMLKRLAPEEVEPPFHYRLPA
jgi:transposase